MSDDTMADYYREQEIGQFDDDIRFDSLWKTKTGKLIAVKDMDDQHLLNTIRCLRDQSPIGTTINVGSAARRRQWVNVMANEAYARNLMLDELKEEEPVHE